MMKNGIALHKIPSMRVSGAIGYSLTRDFLMNKKYKNVHSMVRNAIRKGLLHRPEVCEKCGNEPKRRKDGISNIHGHHEDYNKPLDVQWLCAKCHMGITERDKGEDHYFSKYTNELVIEVYNDISDHETISQKYKISLSAVKHIKSGNNWSWLTNHIKRDFQYPRGVRPVKESRRFMANIMKKGKRIYLGTFETVDEAHQAYLNELTKDTE